MLTIEAGDINIFLECGLFSSGNVMLFLIRRKGSNHVPLKGTKNENKNYTTFYFSQVPCLPLCPQWHFLKKNKYCNLSGI